MSKRMLVDATHAEEVRVAIVQDQRLIDLDIETASREQIKGNIYLAKITRVEPALQAAFVEFHSGRQGFLSINDIHHKYYPAEEPPREEKKPSPTTEATVEATGSSQKPDTSTGDEQESNQGQDISAGENKPLLGDEEDADTIELPPSEELKFRPRRRHFPIQRILSKGQSILVQVAKEARGNKGASLTTNISLAGRYTVLLPENSGGGGISRKIMDPTERKHLKGILSSMEIPDQVSLIIRTAGLGRTKREISRDMSYLLRLWKMILEKKNISKAPTLIHEEGDLIIRTIRDLYTTDMEEILIEGQDGYRIGKDFMRLLMPRYVKVVQPYKDSIPLFARHQIENQIESMHERKVQLRSGGYLVIDPTEALVSIDINSGRSTKERDVESTAFKTNQQAAEEIGRQLRMRDLGGLIVIDFIDMDDKKHIIEVERKLKEAVKLDRAKIQVGKMSQFGLLELSRQRMKPAFSETNRLECPRCKGLGTIRSVDSAAIHLFRQLEEEVAKGVYSRLIYTTSQEVANFLLNQKRGQIQDLETNHATNIVIYGDSSLQTPEFYKNRIERTQEPHQGHESQPSNQPNKSSETKEENPQQEDSSHGNASDEDSPHSHGDSDDDHDDKKSRGKRGRRGKRGKKDKRDKQEQYNPAAQTEDNSGNSPEPNQQESHPPASQAPSRAEEEVETGEKSRRGRRRRRKKPAVVATSAHDLGSQDGTATVASPEQQEAETVSQESDQKSSSSQAGIAETTGSDEAIATHVPGLYVMSADQKPEQLNEHNTAQPASEKSEVAQGADQVEGTPQSSDAKEETSSGRPPRRRRRRRRPNQARSHQRDNSSTNDASPDHSQEQTQPVPSNAEVANAEVATPAKMTEPTTSSAPEEKQTVAETKPERKPESPASAAPQAQASAEAATPVKITEPKTSSAPEEKQTVAETKPERKPESPASPVPQSQASAEAATPVKMTEPKTSSAPEEKQTVAETKPEPPALAAPQAQASAEAATPVKITEPKTSSAHEEKQKVAETKPEHKLEPPPASAAPQAQASAEAATPVKITEPKTSSAPEEKQTITETKPERKPEPPTSATPQAQASAEAASPVKITEPKTSSAPEEKQKVAETKPERKPEPPASAAPQAQASADVATPVKMTEPKTSSAPEEKQKVAKTKPARKPAHKPERKPEPPVQTQADAEVATPAKITEPKTSSAHEEQQKVAETKSERKPEPAPTQAPVQAASTEVAAPAKVTVVTTPTKVTKPKTSSAPTKSNTVVEAKPKRQQADVVPIQLTAAVTAQVITPQPHSSNKAPPVVNKTAPVTEQTTGPTDRQKQVKSQPVQEPPAIVAPPVPTPKTEEPPQQSTQKPKDSV